MGLGLLDHAQLCQQLRAWYVAPPPLLPPAQPAGTAGNGEHRVEAVCCKLGLLSIWGRSLETRKQHEQAGLGATRGDWGRRSPAVGRGWPEALPGRHGWLPAPADTPPSVAELFQSALRFVHSTRGCLQTILHQRCPPPPPPVTRRHKPAHRSAVCSPRPAPECMIPHSCPVIEAGNKQRLGSSIPCKTNLRGLQPLAAALQHR